MDFIEIVNCIFINKKKYWEIPDEDKEKNFFIINKKFSRQYPKISNFFNNKKIDKPTALDRWYFFFENVHRIPQWYWGNNTKKNKKSNKKDLTEKQTKQICERINIKPSDVEFIQDNYEDELKKYLKKIRRYE